MIFGEGPIIKNIAGDLNKLFLQGTRAGQPINNVEGDAAADQGTIQLMADQDPVIRDISTGLGWAGREVTVSGTGALQLVNSLGRPLKSWSVELAPYQEGSGDPSPENIRPIHGTNKLKLFVEESYDPSATPKAIIDVPTLSANQWNEEWEVGAYNADGSKTNPTDRIRCKNAISIIPSETYYFVIGTGNTVMFYLFLDADGVNQAGSIASIVANGIITTPAWARVMAFYTAGSYGTIYKSDIAVNYPSTVTTYNPYSNTIYNGAVGSDGGESRKGKYTFKGNETWNDWVSQYGFFSTSLSLNPPKIESIQVIVTTNGIALVVYDTGAVRVYLNDNPSITAETNMNDVMVNGIEFLYDLATPIQFPLTTSSIPTPQGTATAWATAEDGTVESMEVSYVESA